jgi:hypothetical protein
MDLAYIPLGGFSLPEAAGDRHRRPPSTHLRHTFLTKAMARANSSEGQTLF